MNTFQMLFYMHRLSLYRLNPKDGSLQNLDYVPQNPAEVSRWYCLLDDELGATLLQHSTGL